MTRRSLPLMALFLLSSCGGEDPLPLPDASWGQDLAQVDLRPADSATDATVLPPDMEPPPPTLEIAHLDVAQGDSTLVVGPQGVVVIIDGGRGGMGRNVLVPALRSRGIQGVDYVIATHPDVDHIGGLSELVEEGVDVLRGFFSNGIASETDSYQRLVEAAQMTSAGELVPLWPGMVIDLGGQATMTCLIVAGELPDGTQLDTRGDNDRSVGLRVSMGAFDYWVGGDLEEAELALGDLVGDLDVLHIHHHGSSSSSHVAFLELTRPEVGIISVGPNSYSHPSQAVLDRLMGRTAELTIPPLDLYLTEAGSGGTGGLVLDGPVVVITDGLEYDVAGRQYRTDEGR